MKKDKDAKDKKIERLNVALREETRRADYWVQEFHKKDAEFHAQKKMVDAYRATAQKIVVAYARNGSNLNHEWVAQELAGHLK